MADELQANHVSTHKLGTKNQNENSITAEKPKSKSAPVADTIPPKYTNGTKMDHGPDTNAEEIAIKKEALKCESLLTSLCVDLEFHTTAAEEIKRTICETLLVYDRSNLALNRLLATRLSVEDDLATDITSKLRDITEATRGAMTRVTMHRDNMLKSLEEIKGLKREVEKVDGGITEVVGKLKEVLERVVTPIVHSGNSVEKLNLEIISLKKMLEKDSLTLDKELSRLTKKLESSAACQQSMGMVMEMRGKVSDILKKLTVKAMPGVQSSDTHNSSNVQKTVLFMMSVLLTVSPFFPPLSLFEIYHESEANSV